MAKEIFRNLRKDYRIIVVQDNQYGSLNTTTSSWNGMIGEILNGVFRIV